MKDAILLFLMSFHVRGVLHEETQEQKTADVILLLMAGETVTLESGVINIQRNDLTVWTFGDTRIALMNKEPGQILLFDGDDGMFRDKLHLNNQTGYLTITNITTEQTGFYQLRIFNRGDFFRKFLVTVSAHLPVPVISKNASSLKISSVSKCVLLCSVMNVSHVSLSWYKGNSLLSSISVSDLNIRLSLPLEVEYHETNTYSCVVNNPITNHTQHLNITHVCGIIPPVYSLHPGYIVLMCVIATALAVVGVYCQSKSGKAKHKGQHDGEVQQNQRNGHIQADEELAHIEIHNLGQCHYDCESTNLLRKPNEEDVPQRYPSNEDEVDQHNNAQGEISEQENSSTCSSNSRKEYMQNDAGMETSNLETDSQSDRNIEDQQNYAHGEISNQENSSTCSSNSRKEYMQNDGTETSNLETDSQSDRNIEDQQNYAHVEISYQENSSTCKYMPNNDVFVEATDGIRNLTVKEGQSVTLRTDVTTIKEDDVILWMFAESTQCNQTVKFKTIARRMKANEWEYVCGYERFGDRLQLDNQTGLLTITNISCIDAGLYKLCMPRKKTWKTFIVAVQPKIQRRNTVE